MTRLFASCKPQLTDECRRFISKLRFVGRDFEEEKPVRGSSGFLLIHTSPIEGPQPCRREKQETVVGVG